eukprot:1161972-Pelagomonas_calceolata.AAC.2
MVSGLVSRCYVGVGRWEDGVRVCQSVYCHESPGQDGAKIEGIGHTMLLPETRCTWQQALPHVLCKA